MVATSWEGECEPGLLDVVYGAYTVGGTKTVPCNFVEYNVKVACDGDACTSRVDNDWIEITPTKLGVLKAHVTLDPKGLRRRKTFDLKPVLVANPTAASAQCELWADGTAQVDVTVQADGKELDHTSTVSVVGGGACTTNEWRSRADDKKRTLTCPLDARNAQLDVAGPGGYHLQTSVSCQLIYPAPELVRQPDKPAFFTISDPYNNRCPDLLEKSRDAFAKWGWKIGEVQKNIETGEYGHPKGTARFTAERTGIRVDVALTYRSEGDDPGCTWEMQAPANAAIVGSDQLPDR
jgi:hypothetical protein